MVPVSHKAAAIPLEFLVFATDVCKIGLVGLLFVVMLPLSLAGKECSFHLASLVLVIAFLLCLLAESINCNVYLTLPLACLACKFAQGAVAGTVNQLYKLQVGVFPGECDSD